jgi:hypothetical protein
MTYRLCLAQSKLLKHTNCVYPVQLFVRGKAFLEFSDCSGGRGNGHIIPSFSFQMF